MPLSRFWCLVLALGHVVLFLIDDFCLMILDQEGRIDASLSSSRLPKLLFSYASVLSVGIDAWL